MEELQDYTEKEESNFDFKAELYKYLAYWKWLVLGCVVGLIIAFLYNRYTTPEYKSWATMMVLQDNQRNLAGALPSGGGSFMAVDNSSMANQIETLYSKRLVKNVIDELDLNVAYFLEGNVIAVEAYKNNPLRIEFLTADTIVHQTSMDLIVTPQSATTYKLIQEETGYSETHEFGEAVTVGNLEFSILPRGGEISSRNTVTIQIRPLTWVANDFISRMEINPKGRAKDILALSVNGEVPQKSEDFLNSLMKHFNLDGMADKRQVAESTAEFIQDRLHLISEELDTVERGIAEFKRENRFMDIASGAGIYRAQSASTEQEIFGIDTKLVIIRSVRDALTSSDPYTLLPSSGGIEEGGIAGQVTSYNTLVQERNALLKASTPKNPVVETVTEQLDSLRQNLIESIDSTIRTLNLRKRELAERGQQAEGQFSVFPGLENRMRNIERQQQIKEQLYLFLLQRREESAISFAATAPVAKVIDRAFSEGTPVDPGPWLILTGGGVVGFLVPLLLIFTINFLDTKVHHKGDVQSEIKNIPLLGEIPRVTNEEHEVIQANDRSPLAESFRILRTNLAYMVQSRNREKAEVIFVTSTVKGEGKTFISYNMARTLASTGKKVLLIGADIRNPRLHKYTKDNLANKGLSDYLYNYDIQPSSLIQASNDPEINVDLIFSGAIPPNPAELLMNERMEQLVNSLKKDYDFIIVDTAPTMIVTDTLLISPLADTTLYVIRAGFTEKKLLEFPKDLKKQGKLKGLALVLNDVDYSKFSYGAKYGYAYGYGYGYGVDEEKGIKSFLKNPFGKN